MLVKRKNTTPKMNKMRRTAKPKQTPLSRPFLCDSWSVLLLALIAAAVVSGLYYFTVLSEGKIPEMKEIREFPKESRRKRNPSSLNDHRILTRDNQCRNKGLNSNSGYSQCAINTGWPYIYNHWLNGKTVMCGGNVMDSQIPSSNMICWKGKAPTNEQSSNLCVIRNFYAEVELKSGRITWKLLNCENDFNQSRIPLYSHKFTNYNDTVIHQANIDDVSQFESMKVWNESLAIAFYRIVTNPWHAVADASAHWISVKLAQHLLSDPKQMGGLSWDWDTDWTLVRTQGVLGDDSNFLPLFDKMWGTVRNDLDSKALILERIGWPKIKTDTISTILVRIPQVIFPLIHYSGLPWNIQDRCHNQSDHRNPVYMEWAQLCVDWMNQLIESEGPSLIAEMCGPKRDQFRLFPVSEKERRQSDGWMSQSECRSFWITNHSSPLLLFGDRHKNQKGSNEPCGSTHRCIGNLNEMRDALLVEFGQHYRMVMGNTGALSLQSQFELLQRTDVMFGMHGAMFSLSQFMRTGSSVFEIQPRDGYAECKDMIVSMGMDYGLYKCLRCGNQKENRLKIDELIHSLKEFLKNKSFPTSKCE